MKDDRKPSFDDLWMSDCKRYVARELKGSSFPDVVEIATGKVWLAHRYRPTGFDDPRCGIPDSAHEPVAWGNRGRWKRKRTREEWIKAFDLVFYDYDMTKIVRFATPALARFEATFRRRVPAAHVQRHAFVDAAIRAALAATAGSTS